MLQHSHARRVHSTSLCHSPVSASLHFLRAMQASCGTSCQAMAARAATLAFVPGGERGEGGTIAALSASETQGLCLCYLNILIHHSRPLPLPVHSCSTVTWHRSPVEHSTHDKSARIMNEFENADPQVLGQCIFQVPHMQQLAAHHHRFHKGAGMLHIEDTLTRLVNVFIEIKSPA